MAIFARHLAAAAEAAASLVAITTKTTSHYRLQTKSKEYSVCIPLVQKSDALVYVAMSVAMSVDRSCLMVHSNWLNGNAEDYQIQISWIEMLKTTKKSDEDVTIFDDI